MSAFVPFVALEFTSALGPTPGRYLVRMEADGGADVLQIGVVGAAPASGGLVFRRARKAEPNGRPREVSLLVATLIGTTNAFDGRADAAAFLHGCRGDEGQQAELVEQTVDAVNVAVRAYRAAARDPFLGEVTPADAREVRIGYGEAGEITKGGWTEAFTPAPPRSRSVSRAERLRPTEVVSLALAGRLPLLAAEDLALRTMLDLERDRPRSAAVQLRACIDLLVAELTEAGESFAPPREDLERQAVEVGRLAGLALEGGLDGAAVQELRECLDRVEDALEDWRAWHNPA